MIEMLLVFAAGIVSAIVLISFALVGWIRHERVRSEARKKQAASGFRVTPLESYTKNSCHCVPDDPSLIA